MQSAIAHVVIPARLGSTRLAEKLLLRATGKSVLQHTYEAAKRAQLPSGVTIAVDHPRLQEEVARFGGKSVMTRPECPSGTDRIAEALQEIPDAEIIVNVQGDEPEMEPGAIDLVVRLLREHPEASIATVGTPIREIARLNNPNCVKIVMGNHQRALYFSRAAVPFVRQGIKEEDLHEEPPLFWHHLGIYAYRRDFLRRFAALPVGRLEQLEKLEQLRALEAGEVIVAGRVDRAPPGIDTAEDYQAFVGRVQQAS